MTGMASVDQTNAAAGAAGAAGVAGGDAGKRGGGGSGLVLPNGLRPSAAWRGQHITEAGNSKLMRLAGLARAGPGWPGQRGTTA